MQSAKCKVQNAKLRSRVDPLINLEVNTRGADAHKMLVPSILICRGLSANRCQNCNNIFDIGLYAVKFSGRHYIKALTNSRFR